MYFAEQAGMQSLFAQDCRAHPYGAVIEYRANVHVWVASQASIERSY